MGTKVLISPEQYLATYYEREPEYVRGELKEKPMPDGVHSWIQRMLMIMFVPAQNGLIGLAEVRCKLAVDVYRLSDVAVFRASEPMKRVPKEPPLAVIEIVSEDDKYVDLLGKLEDYSTWGVPHIWVVDPWTRRLAVWENGTLVSVDVLTLPEHNFDVHLDQLLGGAPTD